MAKDFGKCIDQKVVFKDFKVVVVVPNSVDKPY